MPRLFLILNHDAVLDVVVDVPRASWISELGYVVQRDPPTLCLGSMAAPCRPRQGKPHHAALYFSTNTERE